MQTSIGLSLMLGGLLWGTLSFAKLHKLTPDGTVLSLQAELPAPPYQEDEYYAYSSSPSFSRLIFNPWNSPQFKDAFLSIVNGDSNNKRAVLISEFSIPTKALNPLQSYRLLLRRHYICRGLEPQSCYLTTDVRCYGSQPDGKQGAQFASSKSSFGIQGELVSLEVAFNLPAGKCQEGIQVSLEGSIIPRQSLYGFRSVDISIKN